jgi:hypothetical protein
MGEKMNKGEAKKLAEIMNTKAKLLELLDRTNRPYNIQNLIDTLKTGRTQTGMMPCRRQMRSPTHAPTE